MTGQCGLMLELHCILRLFQVSKLPLLVRTITHFCGHYSNISIYRNVTYKQTEQADYLKKKLGMLLYNISKDEFNHSLRLR